MTIFPSVLIAGSVDSLRVHIGCYYCMALDISSVYILILIKRVVINRDRCVYGPLYTTVRNKLSLVYIPCRFLASLSVAVPAALSRG